MTIKFMRGVIFETAYWLPRNEDMTFHSCAEEPSCKEIAAELKLALIKACNEGDWKNESERRRCRNTAQLIADFPPDKTWALNVLGTFVDKMNLSHRYFDRDYVKPRTVDIEPELDNGLVPNVNKIFDGVPVPEQKGKLKRSTIVGLTKRERIERGLRKLKLRREKQDAKIAKLQTELQEEALEAAQAGQHVGRKRKRREVEPEAAQPNVIGNLQDIEESKDEVQSEAQSEVPPKRITRSKSPKKGGKGNQPKTPGSKAPRSKTPRSKSPYGSAKLRQSVRINAGEMTGSGEITNKVGKLSLKESKTVKIGQFKTAPEEDSDSMDVDTVNRIV